MTNFEKIKSMSIEEMAEFLHSIDSNFDGEELIFSCFFRDKHDIEMHDSYGDIKKWLGSEVE